MTSSVNAVIRARRTNDGDQSRATPPRQRSFWSTASWRLERITLIWSGLLLLGFVAYQLWGTSIQTNRTQNKLAAQFAQLTADSEPLPGGVMARIKAPTIGLDAYVVRGVRYKDLTKGPGWFTNTVNFGEPGVAAIAGHRTSFGAPFADLDQLHKGQVVTIETKRGLFTYVVTYSKIVKPSDDEILHVEGQTFSELALVTCHPKWTSTKRLVVFATLSDSSVTSNSSTTTSTVPSEPTEPTVDDGAVVSDALNEGWMHDGAGTLPTIVWGGLAVLIWNGSKWIASRRTRWVGRLGIRAAGCAPFAFTMYFFYENVSRILPVNL